MAANRDRVYWNDSKTTVRRKLGLQDNEEFSKFENICSNAYRFKLSLDPTLNWDKLARSAVIEAQNLIKAECVGTNLELVDKDGDFNDFIEWKLYQLHKPMHKRLMKRMRNESVTAESSDHTSQPSASTPESGWYYLNQPSASPPKPGSYYTTQPSASPPKPESYYLNRPSASSISKPVSSRDFDPVKAAVQDAKAMK